MSNRRGSEILCTKMWERDPRYPCARRPDHRGNHMAFYKMSKYPIMWAGDSHWPDIRDE